MNDKLQRLRLSDNLFRGYDAAAILTACISCWIAINEYGDEGGDRLNLSASEAVKVIRKRGIDALWVRHGTAQSILAELNESLAVRSVR